MILESTIEQIVEQQRQWLAVRDSGLRREKMPDTRSLSSHALIISGVRRCGKSTLLLQMMKDMEDTSLLYLNFESPQLYGFALADCVRLDRVIAGKKVSTLMFDEIQLVEAWEVYIRQKLDEGYRIILTGSNASLLSKELGTKLTGRHTSHELYPFSYGEYLSFRKKKPSTGSLESYLHSGGFPEFLKSGNPEQLGGLFDDILIRDIVTRYGIKDIVSLKRLAVFLFSNAGNRITATKLRQTFRVGATSTILNWFSHLELSWLLFFIPTFSYSARVQLVNPKKIYTIDTGMNGVVSGSMTEDAGRRLENLVFLHLRRKYRDICYFNDHGECDFVVIHKGKVAELVQVCYELEPDNLDREMDGLLQAMRFFKKPEATIVTFNSSDEIMKDGFQIHVIPAYKYLME